MNITAEATTKMVPQKSIKVSIELTEEDAAAFIKHYGCVSSCSHPVTKALFNEISQALSKPPVDDAPTKPQQLYPVGTKVKFKRYNGIYDHRLVDDYGIVKAYSGHFDDYLLGTDNGMEYRVSSDLVETV